VCLRSVLGWDEGGERCTIRQSFVMSGKGIIGIWYNSGLLAGGIRYGIYPNFLLRHIYECRSCEILKQIATEPSTHCCNSL
jgi:hypothetical protein